MKSRFYLRWHVWLAATLALQLLSATAHAQATESTLRNVRKVSTVITYDATGPKPYGLTEERLRTILELKLRTAGIRVLTAAEDKQDSDINPYCFLSVSSLGTSNKGGQATGFAYTVSLSLRVIMIVPFNGSLAPAELWSDTSMGVGPPEDSGLAIERMVERLTDNLANQWLKENPKR